MRLFNIPILACLYIVTTVHADPLTTTEQQIADFNGYCIKFNKNYTDSSEYTTRFHTYLNHTATIHQHNTAALDNTNMSHFYGINTFTDWTREEYKSWLNTYTPSNRTADLTSFDSMSDATMISYSDVPPYSDSQTDTVDWRNKNVVGDVLNQGQCGACWAFSATGAMSVLTAYATGKHVQLSVQQLVDCVNGGSEGCQVGGEMKDGFEYAKANGMMSDATYRYTATDQHHCSYNADNIVARIGGYESVPTGDEEALKRAVFARPAVSVGIDATSLQMYSHGILQDSSCSSTALDHGVLVVGYGHDAATGLDYWLVKNSWGAQWGEGGYLRMQRNANNMCGIATDASYPVLH